MGVRPEAAVKSLNRLQKMSRITISGAWRSRIKISMCEARVTAVPLA
jgi:hypothetical protein